jgi:hypothetical protein
MAHGEWMSLMDYAMKNGVSLSTLRRHIKAKKIEYRLENGRYLICQSQESTADLPDLPNLHEQSIWQTLPSQYSSSDRGEEAAFLRSELQKAHEEIAELKTLIALYEEKALQPRSDS